jgi:hypothetical protein
MYIASSTGRARSSDTNSARLARRANSTAASEFLAWTATIDFAGDARHLRSGLLRAEHAVRATSGERTLLLLKVLIGVNLPSHNDFLSCRRLRSVLGFQLFDRRVKPLLNPSVDISWIKEFESSIKPCEPRSCPG